MKKLLLLLVLCSPAFSQIVVPTAGQTAVTGNVRDLGATNLSGVTVRFYLRGCGGNQPRVPGVGTLSPASGAVWYKDFVSDSTGLITGSLYATRDSTGNANGSIECGGSYTSEWYGLVVIQNGKAGPEMPVQAKNGATIDISNITPITVNPVVVAPTGDSTYARLDGGNQGFTGAIAAPSISSKNVNGTRSAGPFPGVDIGAQVNAAFADCVASSGCQVIIPSGIYTYTTAIVVPNWGTLLCPNTIGVSQEEQQSVGSASTVQLTYNGTGIAITANNNSAVRGCSLTLGTLATEGVRLQGSHATAAENYITGGGTSTKLIHATTPDGSKITEGARIERNKLFDFVGIGVALDYVNDTNVFQNIAYGRRNVTTGVPNQTSIVLVLDTAATGTQVTDFPTGASGLHGLVVRNTLGGLHNYPPFWLFIDDFMADCTYSDGILFDSSLGTTYIGATIERSWSAGSGTDCQSPVTVLTPAAAGIHISGGAGIFITGGTKIRANAGSGVLIDIANSSDLSISNSMIHSNNYANAAGGMGIDVTQNETGLVIANNSITNIHDANGHQKYAVRLSALGGANFIITGNNMGSNETGLINNLGPSNILVASGNSDTGTPKYADNSMFGNLRLNTVAGGSVSPWLAASFGASTSFRVGLGANLRFDVASGNWLCDTDGVSNGCAGLLGANDGTFSVYTNPTNTPASAQSITDANLTLNKRFSFGAPNIANAGLRIDLSLAADGGAFKHKRFGATTATAATANATAQTTYAWTSAFPDANYTPVCTPAGTITGTPVWQGIVSYTSTGVTIQVMAATAVASSFGAVYCYAAHD